MRLCCVTRRISSATQRDYVLTLPLTRLTSGAPLPYGFNVIGDGVFYWLARSNLKETDNDIKTILSKKYDMRDEDDAKTLFRLVVAMGRVACKVCAPCLSAP